MNVVGELKQRDGFTNGEVVIIYEPETCGKPSAGEVTQSLVTQTVSLRS